MEFIPQWAVGVGVIIVAVSIARALSAGLGGTLRRRLRGAEGEITVEVVTELRQAVDTLQQRLAEVEERLDFAERLLAKPPR
jgi:chorismate-pyruvate lyase